jgi:diacylglycerol kinase family enzyme
MMPNAAVRLSRELPARSDFAVLLNANAKLVNRNVRRTLEGVVPEKDLFLSRSPDEAISIAETVLARRYETVFTGGGDGTFVSWVNHIVGQAERRALPVPRFGVLALGTGNAVAEVVGARPAAHVEALAAFTSGATRLRRLDLLTCEGRRTPFAGVGVDAAILNDYCWLKGVLGETALRRLATGASGYALSVALRSAPRYLFERRPSYCEVVNVGRPAFRLDSRGRQVGPAIRRGELLYAGPCMMAAASTVPFYGFGLRVFPFAESRPGMMQLRIATQLGVPTVLLNLGRIWSGDFEHPGLLDFHADRVAIQFERPVPIQVGGDAEGWRETVTFEMDGPPVEMVDFTAAPDHRLGLLN